MRFEDGVARNAPGYEAVTMTPSDPTAINYIGQANLASQTASIATQTPLIGTTTSVYAINSIGGYLKIFAGSNQSLVDTGNTTLTATFIDTYGDGSHVPEVVWSQLSGPTVTIASPTSLSTAITGMPPGTYEFKISASDNDVNPAAKAEATVKVTVQYRATVFTSGLFYGPAACCFHPNTGFIYVSQAFGTDPVNGEIAVYDPYTNTLASEIYPIIGNSEDTWIPSQMVYSPLDDCIYVINATSIFAASPGVGAILKIDISNGNAVSLVDIPADIIPTTICSVGDSGMIIGGYNNATLKRTFLIYDPVAMTFGSSNDASSTSIFDLQGPMASSYNLAENTVYGVGLATGGGGTILYTFSLTDGSVSEYTDLSFTAHSMAYCDLDGKLYYGQDSGGLGLWRSSTDLTSLETISGTAYLIGWVLWEPFNQKIYYYQGDPSAGDLRSFDPVANALTPNSISAGQAFSRSFVSYGPLTNSLYLPFFNGVDGSLYVVNAP